MPSLWPAVVARAMCGHGVIAVGTYVVHDAGSRDSTSSGSQHGRQLDGPHYWFGRLEKLTSICIFDETSRRLWRRQCPPEPEGTSGGSKKACGRGGARRPGN
jgi:hypothetical protein